MTKVTPMLDAAIPALGADAADRIAAVVDGF
jgi:hypothetical protein